MIVQDLFEAPQSCPECGGISFSDLILAEKKDACYYKVKASAKVWPSAYASGRLVQCRKKGADNYGKSKNEGVAEGSLEEFAPVLARGVSMAGSAALKGAQAIGGALAKGAQAVAPKIARAGQTIGKVSGQIEKGLIKGFEVLDALVPGGIFNPDGTMKSPQILSKYLTPQQIQQVQQHEKTNASLNKNQGVAEGFPHDVDHMPGPVIRNADMTTDNVKTKDKAEWDRATDSINARVFDDMSEFRTDSKGETVVGDSAVWAKWDNATQTGWFNAKGRPLKPWPVKEQGVAEATGDDKFDSMMGKISSSVIKQAQQQRELDTIQSIADAMCNDQKCDYNDLSDQDLEFIAGQAGSSIYNVMAALGRQQFHPKKDIGKRDIDDQGVAESSKLAEEFDLIESIIDRLAEHNGVDAELIWEDLESLTDDELYVFAVTTPLMEDWKKVNKRDKTDGMSRKAVNAYRRENPGSKLKTAVTTKPSKLKKGGKASKRRKSYCSRSRGQMKMHSISCAKTPDKAICKARRRWNCESVDLGQGLAEAINPDITNPAFSHQQQIGDYLYVARYWGKGLKISAYHGKKLIGRADLMYHSGWDEPSEDPRTGNPKKFWLESEITEVNPKYQRQGIMSTMYAYARMLGNTIKPSGLQSDEAQAAWKSWRQAGDKEHLTKMQAEGVAEAQLDEINWKKAAATGAMALGAMGAMGASGSAQARVMQGPDGQMSPSFAQQMAQQTQQADQTGAEKVERSADGIVVHYDGKEYKGVLVPKDGPTPRGAKMIKITQAQMGERGIGSYTAYLMPNGTAFIYKLAGQSANEGVAKGDNKKIGGRYDPDEFDDLVQRLKKLAGAGPMKTVYDPEKRVYRNVPVAQQPDKK